MDNPNEVANQMAHEDPHPATQDPLAPRAVSFDSPVASTHDSKAFIQELEQLVLLQQEPLVILKLAAYAADAMRVLGSLGRQADMSTALADTLKDICPDWRNPGALDDPADLIAVAMYCALDALQKTMAGLERAMEAMHASA